MARLAVLAALAALAATGCGASSSPRPQPIAAHSPAEQIWIQNAQRFIADVQANVQLSTAGGANLATARRALTSESDLYTILVAYTNFDGCVNGLESVGTPSHRLAHIVLGLTAACRRLTRASSLFHRAVTRDEARALLAATRLALGTEPLLVAAKDELETLSNPG